MRPRRSKPSGSRSLPHRETPTHRLGLTAEEEHAFYRKAEISFPCGLWLTGVLSQLVFDFLMAMDNGSPDPV